MQSKDKKKRIRAQIGEVRCQGCKEKIQENDDLSQVEYVKTKRGSEWFFHSECMDKVWKGGIV